MGAGGWCDLRCEAARLLNKGGDIIARRRRRNKGGTQELVARGDSQRDEDEEVTHGRLGLEAKSQEIQTPTRYKLW